MKLLPLCLFFFLGFWLPFQPALAQEATPVYRLETTDGNEYLGTIASQTADTVQLKTEKLGVLRFARQDIKSMELVRPAQLKGGKYWFDNPQSTRYLFAPTGYGLRKGEGYYQNIWVFLNQVSMGISNNFSVGFGLVPAFLLGGPTPIWLVPKVSIPVRKDKFNLGVGAAIGTVLGTHSDDFGESDSQGFGVLFGLATVGSRNQNLSVGLGYGYAGDGLARSPTITISGLLRTGPRGYLITENYIISSDAESFGLIGLGGRRIIKRAGIDFGLIFFAGAGASGLNSFPFLGLTLPLGRPAS